MRKLLIVLAATWMGCAAPALDGEDPPAPSPAADDAKPGAAPHDGSQPAPAAPGATTSTVSGVVRRPSGDPVAKASVELGGVVVTSDASGHYQFANVAPGPHTVTVTWGDKPCIAKATKSVTVIAGDNAADVKLGGADAIVRKTMVIDFDPVIESQGGKHLSKVKGWNDAKLLTQQYVDTLAQCSGGIIDYKVVEWIDADAFPIKADGFRYTDATYLAGNFHQPDTVRYSPIVQQYDLVNKVNAGTIDEVIMWGGPYFGYYESLMVGPTAYFVNSDGYLRADLKRNFVIMGLNYERGLADAIHSYGHRVESIMAKVYGRWDSKSATPNAWELFAARDSERKNSGGCGSVHFPPNGTADYDYANDTTVQSRCQDYEAWPALTGGKSAVSYTKSWKASAGDPQLDYLRYWFGHLPQATGVHADGKQNAWWKYAADFNAYAESR